MQKINIPEGYHAITPYFILHEAAAFMDWAIEVLGAVERTRNFHPDGVTLSHSELIIGDSIMMASEASKDWGVNTSSLFVYVADVDATYARAMATGASSLMPLSTQSYGRTCGIQDRWGNIWWPTQA